MQASQNTAQAFLGVNFKCNACHDSFVSKWKLKDAYGLAAYFSPEPKLRLYRCDVARDEYTEPSFFFPELARPTPSASLADRRATLVEIFTDPRNGRMPRTIVNRSGPGSSVTASSRTRTKWIGQPWSPELLDWLAADFVASKYDLKHLIGTIVKSRAYQMAAVSRTAEAPARGYQFRGPEIRRISAEQFADAIGSITGEWSIYTPPAATGRRQQGAGRRTRSREAVEHRSAPSVPRRLTVAGRAGAVVAPSRQAADAARGPTRAGRGGGPASRRRRAPTRTPVTSGVYAREFRAASTLLDPGARTSDSRSGDIGPRAGSDDAPGARAGEWRDPDESADARRAAHGRRAAAGSEEPVQRVGGRPVRPGAPDGCRYLERVEALPDRLRYRLERAGANAAGLDEPAVGGGGRHGRAAIVADASRRLGTAQARRRPTSSSGEEQLAPRV